MTPSCFLDSSTSPPSVEAGVSPLDSVDTEVDGLGVDGSPAPLLELEEPSGSGVGLPNANPTEEPDTGFAPNENPPELG